VIDATVGGATANSFVTLAEAEAYHAARLHNDIWVSTGNTAKERTLIWATRMLSGLSFRGSVVSTDQKLPWPRSGLLDPDGRVVSAQAIPDAVKEAASELAFLLLEGDRTKKSGPEGLRRVKLGDLEIEADPITEPSMIPEAVRQPLRHYLSSSTSSSFSLVRV